MSKNKRKILLITGFLLFLFAGEIVFDSVNNNAENKDSYVNNLYTNSHAGKAVIESENALNDENENLSGQIEMNKNYVLLEYPDVLQNNSYTCGAWAGLTVLYYYGIREYADTLAGQMNTKPETGTEMEDIALVLNKYGLKTEMRQMTISEIKDYINNKIPVVVLLQAYNPSGKYAASRSKASLEWGHYVIIIGYGEGNIVFEDPDALGKMYLSENQFKIRWKGIDEYHEGKEKVLHNYGIAAYGKRPVFRKTQDLLQKIP